MTDPGPARDNVKVAVRVRPASLAERCGDSFCCGGGGGCRCCCGGCFVADFESDFLDFFAFFRGLPLIASAMVAVSTAMAAATDCSARWPLDQEAQKTRNSNSKGAVWSDSKGAISRSAAMARSKRARSSTDSPSKSRQSTDVFDFDEVPI